jgi:hypothetical protein
MMTRSQFAGRYFCVLMTLFPVGLSVFISAPARGQALPAAEASPVSTGFSLPTSLGSLQYAVSASESLIWGFYGNSGPSSSTSVSGDLAYLSNSKRHPFSLIFSGGHSFGESGEPSYNYVNAGFSQVADIGRWNFVLADNVSYLPGTAASGLSGVPGVGDLGVNPIQIGGDASQGVISNYSDRVSNNVGASVSRDITGKTSLNASGSFSTTRFLDSTLSTSNTSSAGLDNDSVGGGAGISHQVDTRNSFGGNYSYSSYSYTNNTFGVAAPGFSSQSANGTYSHRFTPKLAMSLSAGPQWTKFEASSGVTSTSIFVDASATYAGKAANSSLAFVRSTNNGFGVLGGALSNGAVFSIGRRFGIVWNVAATSTYTETSNLPSPGIAPFSSHTYVEGLQVSRAILRSLSGFASYTFENQAASGSGAIDLYSGRTQILGFGITYSPSSLHLGRP